MIKSEKSVDILARMTKKKEELLDEYLLKSRHTIGSATALLFSGVMSVFGIYSVLESAVGENIIYAMSVFVLILLIMDTIKRKYLVKRYNAETKKDILSEFSKYTTDRQIWNHKMIFYGAFLFVVMFDFLGVLSTANLAENKYNASEMDNSYVAKAIKGQIASSATIDENYREDLQLWRELRADAEKQCKLEKQGWKAKYAVKCLHDWEDEHAQPSRPNVKRSLSDSDLNRIEKAGESFLGNWIWYITFVLVGVFTLFLQLTTISSLQEENENVKNKLSTAAIAIIKGRLIQIDKEGLIEAEAEYS
jgi:uncharacterized membrane protein